MPYWDEEIYSHDDNSSTGGHVDTQGNLFRSIFSTITIGYSATRQEAEQIVERAVSRAMICSGRLFHAVVRLVGAVDGIGLEYPYMNRVKTESKQLLAEVLGGAPMAGATIVSAPAPVKHSFSGTGGECAECGGSRESAAHQMMRPCPFCGSVDLKLENLVDEDDYFVSCSRCHVQQIANYTPEKAVERWNLRA